MLLQRIYENRSKRLTQLLSKSKNKLTDEERKELNQLLYKNKNSQETVHQ